MILRRPYAFLIKHFRIIHLILLGLCSYLTIKAYNIMNFFKEYINVKGNIEIISSNYVSFYMVISIILIIAISVIIYLLMRFKKKPRLLYIIAIVISLISGILFIYLYGNIKELETTIMPGKTIRLLRDISRFNYWGLLIISIPMLVRGLGFDIKKFNFTSDIADLKLDEKDNEEVEINVDLTSDGIKRSGNKIKRELSYYYTENKLIINIILIITALILILVFPFNKHVVNRNLHEGETLNTSYFNLKINNSYISERKRISRNNSYVILDIEIKGKVDKYSLKLDNFVLETENNEYIPSLKYYLYFTDIGTGYKKEYLDTKEYNKYILIYNISNKDKDSNLNLKYLENDRIIKLKPKNLD